MTNHPNTPDDVPDITPDLSPEDDAAMRDLLGSLGSGASPQPMPADVQARLDAVIAEQAAERSGSGTGRNVRRLAVAWLGAAAAVFVAVAGIGVVANQMGAGDDAAMESSTMAEDSAGAGSVAPEPSTASSDAADATKDLSATREQLKAAPVIRPDHLAEDAAALPSDQAYSARKMPPARDDNCIIHHTGRPGVQVFVVTYREAPAALVIDQGPPRTATVFSCDNTELQSAVLPD